MYKKEIKIALDVADEQPDGAIFVIPMRLESCDVPERLSKWHWVDEFAPQGYERLCRALEKRAKALFDESEFPADYDADESEWTIELDALENFIKKWPEQKEALYRRHLSHALAYGRVMIKPSSDLHCTTAEDLRDWGVFVDEPDPVSRSEGSRHRSWYSFQLTEFGKLLCKRLA